MTLAPPSPLTFLLFCSERECTRFEHALLTQRPGSTVQSFKDTSSLEAGLHEMKGYARALIIFDSRSPEAWEALAWLKGSAFRHVPVLMACAEHELQKAYEWGANGVATHAWWEGDFAGAMRAFGAFWIETAKLPYVHN